MFCGHIEIYNRNNICTGLRFINVVSVYRMLTHLLVLAGLKPAQYLVEDVSSSEGSEKSIMQPWDGSSLEEIVKREFYLVFATWFFCLRVLLYLSPKVMLHLKSFWGSYVRLHFNLEMFGETSQLLFGRILHMIDVRRIWTKLRLCKTRNFQAGAKNCRVWASSLASVSLGESSSSGRS